MSELPRLLEEIKTVAGLPAALKIAHEKGGGRASIPAKLKADHWLVELLGMETAEKIAFHFTSGRGSVEIEVPLGPVGTIAKARHVMGKMIEGGSASSDAIARATGMSRRTVLRKKKKLRGQGELF
jgi:hypothetical protein